MKSLSRSLYLGGALLALSVATAAAAPATTTADLNLRTGPGMEYPIVISMPVGAIVDVSNCVPGWCEMSWQGMTGFASRAYIEMTTAYAPPAVVVPAPTYRSYSYYEPAPRRVVRPYVYYDTPEYRSYSYYGAPTYRSYSYSGPGLFFNFRDRDRRHWRDWRD